MIPQFPRMHRAAPGVSIVFVLMGCLLGAVRASERAAQTISWRTDYSRAFEEARARNQLLWIQFTGPWCANCARMEQDSFPHPMIQRHAQQSFVPVKLRSDGNEDLALSFELSGLPASVIVAPSRDVVAVHQGYLGPAELGAFLREALARHEANPEPGRRLVPSEASETALALTSPPEKPQDKPKIKTETEVALSGYCPVSLVSDRRLVQGQPEYTARHEGRLYRFTNRLSLNLFRRDPERYAPVNKGYCPVTQHEQGRLRLGNPQWGVLYQGRLYLCATDTERQRFLEQPERYVAIDVAGR
jgi:YHS domain-containing protein